MCGSGFAFLWGSVVALADFGFFTVKVLCKEDKQPDRSTPHSYLTPACTCAFVCAFVIVSVCVRVFVSWFVRVCPVLG